MSFQTPLVCTPESSTVSISFSREPWPMNPQILGSLCYRQSSTRDILLMAFQITSLPPSKYHLSFNLDIR